MLCCRFTPSHCSTGLVPSVLPRRDEGSGMPGVHMYGAYMHNYTCTTPVCSLNGSDWGYVERLHIGANV